MNNRFEFSPYFTIERERTVRNIKTVTAPGYGLVPEMAAFYRGYSSGRSSGVLAGIRLPLHGTTLPNAG